MKLVDLARNISMPIDDFKAFVERKFGIILLSVNNHVPDDILKKIFDDPDIIRDLNEAREKIGLPPMEIPQVPKSDNEEGADGNTTVCDSDTECGITPEAESENASDCDSDEEKSDDCEDTEKKDSDTVTAPTTASPFPKFVPNYGRAFHTGSLIKHCVQNKFKFIADTCSLLHPGFQPFYTKFLKNEISRFDMCLYIPFLVHLELTELSQNQNKEESLRQRAMEALELIHSEMEFNRMAIVGDESDMSMNSDGNRVAHADRILIEKILRFRNNNQSVLLITQDRALAIDNIRSNSLNSVKSSSVILALRLGNKGHLNESYSDGLPEPNPLLPTGVYTNFDTTVYNASTGA